MKQKLIVKIFTQTIIGLALAVIYMQFRPFESYSIDWPLSFLGVWFIFWGWVAYLRYDRLSIFTVTDSYKKEKDKAQEKYEASFYGSKAPGIMGYIHTPIRKSDSEATKADVLKSRMYGNGITGAIFIVLTFIL